MDGRRGDYAAGSVEDISVEFNLIPFGIRPLSAVMCRGQQGVFHAQKTHLEWSIT